MVYVQLVFWFETTTTTNYYYTDPDDRVAFTRVTKTKWFLYHSTWFCGDSSSVALWSPATAPSALRWADDGRFVGRHSVGSVSGRSVGRLASS